MKTKKTGFTLIELMIVVGVIAIIVALALPGLIRAKISTHESAAIAALKASATAQTVFKNAFACDQDTDGNGEYGLFVELSGVDAARGPNGSEADPAYIVEVFGTTSTAAGGIAANKSGYLFRMFLPTDVGPAVSEGDLLALGPPIARSFPLYADSQETRYGLYCWPNGAGNTGNKAYFINPGGEVFYTNNEIGVGLWQYSGLASTPDAGDALDPTNPVGSANLETDVVPGAVTANTLIWFSINQ